MFHRDTNVAKFLPLDALLALSSQDDAFNVLLCLVSMVPERILASVTSVATINLLRFFFFFEVSHGSANSDRPAHQCTDASNFWFC